MLEKSSQEVHELPAPISRKDVKRRQHHPILLLILLVGVVALNFSEHIHDFLLPHYTGHDSTKATCEQVDPLFPPAGSDRLEEMYRHLSTEEFRKGSIERLSGAVQIPTQSYDDMGKIGEDSRWDILYDFAKYLKNTFPRVHEYLNPEIVNTHGLLFTWKGSDESLKPLVLMAHQDVVPGMHDQEP